MADLRPAGGGHGRPPVRTVDGARPGTHAIPFYCDDVRATVAELKGRGVEFVDDIVDSGYGLVTHFRMPGCGEVQLYEPKYAKRSAGTAR